MSRSMQTSVSILPVAGEARGHRGLTITGSKRGAVSEACGETWRLDIVDVALGTSFGQSLDLEERVETVCRIT